MEWDEQAVILGCQQGNARCQELLFKHFYGRMKGICLRYAARPDEAKDLLQESFLKVHQNIGLFRGDSSLTTWISRIKVNNCVSHYRKNKNTFTEELTDEYADEEDPDGYREETEELNHEQVIELIQKLPEG